MSDVRDFLMPDLGEGLEEGDIVEWNVEVGQTIELNQTLAQIETAKAVVEVPSPFAGTVVERFGEVGDTVLVGRPLVRIDVSGGTGTPAAMTAQPAGAATAAEPAAGRSPAQAVAAIDGAEAEVLAPGKAEGEGKRTSVLVGYGAEAGSGKRRRRSGGGGGDGGASIAAPSAPAPQPAPADGPAAGGNGHVLAKPPVRKLAKDLGVDLASIGRGSGPDGTITRDDVQAAASGAGPARATAAPSQLATQPTGLGFRGREPGDVIPVQGIRKRIVARMTESRMRIPEATTSLVVDCTALWRIRKRLTEQAKAEGHDTSISPFALVARATVLALRRFPTLNAVLDEDAAEIRLHDHLNLGVAVDTDRGLMVPVIKNAHTLPTLELAREMQRLAVAARDGSITPGDLTGGTFTINNYGALGTDTGDPIINYPEAGILGVGTMNERPWVINGKVRVRRVVELTIAFDHRISDGGEAGRFVAYVGQLVSDPARILLHA